ncbi:YvrJ family protein [Oceanobacillus chungangensis]|uniref:YvrJ family protein n=1 Tax=Oceanobacillus chungangensis TaxID=1229152 RepID=A0A3D8PYL0_9BACI|nr:YvrJ family protein [Oceanobacillus chungangensis]RDW20892.1 YvrJ family protein [Oceanobacillus chungangensis]
MNEVSALSDMIQLVGNVGFPVVVALILLIRYEVRMERLEKHSENLSDIINELRRDIS